MLEFRIPSVIEKVKPRDFGSGLLELAPQERTCGSWAEVSPSGTSVVSAASEHREEVTSMSESCVPLCSERTKQKGTGTMRSIPGHQPRMEIIECPHTRTSLQPEEYWPGTKGPRRFSAIDSS